MRKIPYSKPSITQLEIDYATDAVSTGWGEKCYEYIHKFENLIKSHLGVKYAISTSSCTGALHMGLAGLNIKTNDEVILADSNWIATAAPIVHLGAKPVFVDILKNSWCLDPEEVVKVINPNTKAIIATHLYGNVCEMEKLIEIGNNYEIPIIEDAAEAIGSKYFGKPVGSIGEFGVFSFHGTKTLTTGEGGVFVTNNKSLYDRVLTLSNHGRVKGDPKQFWAEAIGYKYKMSNVQAAIGCAQLERIDELVEKKRKILSLYKEKLRGLKCLTMNYEPPGVVNGAWMPTAVFDLSTQVTREKLLKVFQSNDIDARVFFWPLSQLPTFHQNYSNPIAESISKRGVNLPSFHDMKETEINFICDVLKSAQN